MFTEYEKYQNLQRSAVHVEVLNPQRQQHKKIKSSLVIDKIPENIEITFLSISHSSMFARFRV